MMHYLATFFSDYLASCPPVFSLSVCYYFAAAFHFSKTSKKWKILSFFALVVLSPAPFYIGL
jgi:hypothetical protein